MRIGVDTGGTFTDFVFIKRGRIRVKKIPSTPDDPSRAILSGLEAERPLPDRAVLVHGSTVATNALLERKLARVTLVTNEGLEDVLEIGRQARPDLYAVEIEKPVPLVPAGRRLGVPARSGPDGEVVSPLRPADLTALRARVEKTRPEAIAVGLLYSYLDEKHEQRIARALRRLKIPVCTSAEVAPEVREYERFSTTVANAALIPVVTRYLEQLECSLPDVRLFVFQSNGGMARARSAARLPVRLVLSGPAGGAVAASRIATRAGLQHALALDMGGTSTDVSLVEGKPLRRGEISIDGLPLLVPSLDIQTVGAGGGSIAWVDQAGLLRVGPRSAGSDPGPACYGHSDEPTCTDAHIVLGRLPDRLAGGTVLLDPDRSHRALERLGKQLGRDARAAAEGVLQVADATMARAARVVAVGRGVDPRGLALIAFGGAGPLHAARLARALPCREALVPRLPGNLSAHGMALADAERDLVRSVLIRGPDARRTEVDAALRRLVEQGREELAADGLLESKRSLRVERTLDCRYAGQTYTLPVGPERSIARAFHREHEQRYGHAFPEREVEVVHVRVRLVVPGNTRSRPDDEPRRRRRAPAAAVVDERDAWFDGRRVRVACYLRDALEAGHRIDGPAIIEELSSTTVVEPGFRAEVDRHGNLRLGPSR